MKLQVLQENLSQALSNASRFVSSRAQLPILSNILLSTKKNKLQVASTNLETSLSIFIGAQVKEEGEIAIPGKVITEIVSNLPIGTIELEGEKEQLKIESQGFSSKLSGMNTSDFPTIPNSVNTKTSISLQKADFLNSLSQVIFASSIDETRPTLTGVLFIFAKNTLTLVATDGYRLSQKKINLPQKSHSGEIESVILPKGTLSEVSRLFTETDEIFFDLKKNENQVLFGGGDLVLSSRVIEGEFPDFEKIIPKTSSLKVGLDKEEFLRAVKLASVFARDSANIIKLNFAKGSVSISAESQNSGSQKTNIDASVEGEVFEIAFNYRFLEDYLHAVSGEEVKIELSNPNAPGIFADPKEANFLHLIMPVKIQS